MVNVKTPLLSLGIRSVLVIGILSVIPFVNQGAAAPTSGSAPCRSSALENFDRANRETAISNAQNSQAFKPELARFTTTKFASTFQTVKWSGPPSCVAESVVYNVVLLGYTSSGSESNIVISESYPGLSVIGVDVQAEHVVNNLPYCPGTPCILGTQSGYEVYVTNGYNACSSWNPNYICILEASTHFYQPTPQNPPTGCADGGTCVFSTWAGLESNPQDNNNLAQAGTAGKISCGWFGCSTSYWAWYEMLPANSITCTGSQNVVIHGGDQIYTYTENEADLRYPSHTLYDFYIYDFQSNMSCQSLANNYNMPAPRYAVYALENPQYCGTNCASLPKFTNANFITNTMQCNYPGSYCPIYGYPNIQDIMENGPGPGPYPNCGLIVNVSTGSIGSPNGNFVSTWQSSQYTPYWNTGC